MTKNHTQVLETLTQANGIDPAALPYIEETLQNPRKRCEANNSANDFLGALPRFFPFFRELLAQQKSPNKASRNAK